MGRKSTRCKRAWMSNLLWLVTRRRTLTVPNVDRDLRQVISGFEPHVRVDHNGTFWDVFLSDGENLLAHTSVNFDSPNKLSFKPSPLFLSDWFEGYVRNNLGKKYGGRCCGESDPDAKWSPDAEKFRDPWIWAQHMYARWPEKDRDAMLVGVPEWLRCK